LRLGACGRAWSLGAIKHADPRPRVASDFDALLRQLRAWTPEELAEIEELATANAAMNATAEVVDLDKPTE